MYAPSSCYVAAEDPADIQWNDHPYPRLMTFLGLMPLRHVRRQRLYAVYVLWVLCCQLVACPYGWFASLARRSVHAYEAAFLILVTCQAPLAWAFLAWYVRRSRHFRRTMVPLLRQHPARTRWEESERSDAWVVLGLYAIAVALKIGWLVKQVYLSSDFRSSSAAVRAVFVILPITFIYRLMAPMLMCQVFAAVSQLHVAKIAEYESEHEARGLGELFVLLTHDMDVRRGTEHAWQFGFLMSITLPCLAAAMFLLLCWWRDFDYVVELWDFPYFALHFMVQAWLTFRSAAAITEASAEARLSIIKKIITGRVVFADTPESFRVEAYLSYLTHCYEGFRVLGIPITRSLLAKLAQAVAVSVPSWALSHLL